MGIEKRDLRSSLNTHYSILNIKIMAKFFSTEEEEQIINAIKAVENKTSGEVRVHIQGKIKKPVLEAGKDMFLKLGMQKTQARNGVLFFIVPKEHKFAILGDKGLDDVVPEHFWEEVRNDMRGFFREGKFGDGLVHAIHKVGNYLTSHFPVQEDDENELSDEISYGD